MKKIKDAQEAIVVKDSVNESSSLALMDYDEDFFTLLLSEGDKTIAAPNDFEACDVVEAGTPPLEMKTGAWNNLIFGRVESVLSNDGREFFVAKCWSLDDKEMISFPCSGQLQQFVMKNNIRSKDYWGIRFKKRVSIQGGNRQMNCYDQRFKPFAEFSGNVNQINAN